MEGRFICITIHRSQHRRQNHRNNNTPALAFLPIHLDGGSATVSAYHLGIAPCRGEFEQAAVAFLYESVATAAELRLDVQRAAFLLLVIQLVLALLPPEHLCGLVVVLRLPSLLLLVVVVVVRFSLDSMNETTRTPIVCLSEFHSSRGSSRTWHREENSAAAETARRTV